MTVAEVIREQARGRDYVELQASTGVTIAGFYIAEGEEVGAGQIVEDDRLDFKAFIPEAGGVQIRHLGGLLVAGLLGGDYSDQAAIAFSSEWKLAPDQVRQLLDWLERREGLDSTPAPIGPRLRLSPFGV